MFRERDNKLKNEYGFPRVMVPRSVVQSRLVGYFEEILFDPEVTRGWYVQGGFDRSDFEGYVFGIREVMTIDSCCHQELIESLAMAVGANIGYSRTGVFLVDPAEEVGAMKRLMDGVGIKKWKNGR